MILVVSEKTCFWQESSSDGGAGQMYEPCQLMKEGHGPPLGAAVAS
jgi:hypothetical protein